MTTTFYITLMIIWLLSFLVIGYTVYYRNIIPSMTGMMIAMTLGMNVGLTIGVLLGIHFSGNLFYSTTFGIITGVVVGFIAGMPVNLMAVLDGMLSGFMGGTMGAMLGEMIAPIYRDAMIKVMFLFFITVMLILLYLMQEEFIKSRWKIGQHPISLILIFGLIFIGFNQLGPTIKNTDMGDPEENKPTNTFVVKANEYTFSPNQIEIHKGEKVTVMLDNTGDIGHHLEFINLHADIQNQKSQGNHQHGDTLSKVDVHADPGEMNSVSFIPLVSGSYRFVCTIPGHKEAGMIGFLKVT